MNPNNKEAIYKLKNAIINLNVGDYRLVDFFIGEAMRVLQDNEDTEVEEELAKDYTCGFCGRENNFYHNSPKPSSKVEKLKELKKLIIRTHENDMEVNNKLSFTLAYLEKLTQILIEDEE